MSYRDNCSVGYVSLLFIVFQSLLICLFYKKPEPALIQGRNYLNRAKEITSVNDNHPSNVSSQCVAMFNIGFRKRENSKNWDILLNQEMKKLGKAKKKFEQQTKDYLPFAKSLVKLVDTTNDGSLAFRNGTRIQNMEGKLPYVPCRIRDYSNEDFIKCIKVRKERNKPLWIAYFGDSKARNMLFYLLNSTHSFMNWTMDGNITFNETYYFHRAVFQIYEKQIDFESTFSEVRMTLIGSPYGIFSSKGKSHMPADVLIEWLRQKESSRLPDILIIEFGIWHFSWANINHDSTHEMFLQTWQSLRTVLKELSKRITIIYHVTTRIRLFALKPHYRSYSRPRDQQKVVQGDFMIMAAEEFIDQVGKHGIENRNIIFWDSTLPLNLASIQECELLVNRNHSSVAEEGKLKSKQFLRFMCNDPTHKTRATVHDERSIILNLACNRFLFKSQEEYCCSN